MAFSLSYGSTGRFTFEVESRRPATVRPAPEPRESAAFDLRAALGAPLDFPPFEQLCIPGDKVTLAVDRHTPRAAELLAEIWTVLHRRGVEAGDVTILQPAVLEENSLADPRSRLPDHVRGAMRWTIHDPTDSKRQAYLAATARGERIYLARELVEADVVVSVGEIAYDPVLGHRGTSSVFYPGLSNVEAIKRARGEGHSELGPDDERPLRQTIDEIAWLLGTQFSVQVISSGGNDVCEVLAGTTESVFRRGTQLLADHWLVRLEDRAELIVVAIDADAAGHGWSQLGAAMATARHLVTKGGKVIVLSELSAELDVGMELIRDSRSPRSALKPIRQQAPPDMIPATQLATLTDWAHVYLLSKLPGDVVDSLFMLPLDNEQEVTRLLAGNGSCVFVGSAQHAYGEVVAGD